MLGIEAVMASWLSPAVLRAFAAGCWIVAFGLTHYPDLGDPGDGAPGPWHGVIDKAPHFALYAGLGAISTLAVLAGRPRRRAAAVSLLLLAMLAYTGLEEATQPWFDRYADWYDWFADAAGAAAGCWFGVLAARRLPNPRGRRCDDEARNPSSV